MIKSKFRLKKWLIFPQEIIARPGVVIGEAGSGKTETLLRLAYLAAAIYHYDVLFLDAKGDRPTAARFVAAMRQAGKQQVKVFPSNPYFGWMGDADALFNRLMAVQTYSEEYYHNIARLLLSLALHVPGEPPRNSRELLENLTLDSLHVRYRGRYEASEIERVTKKDANGVYNRYRAFFSMLQGKLDRGFTLDETDSAYILLDGIAFREETGSIGRFIMEDIAHYIARRKPAVQKVLIIIDEVSALAIENIANLAERLRSFGGAMLLSSQSQQGLARTQDERDRILGTAHTLILHTCNAPERLIERAGKHKQVRAGWGVRDQAGTGYGTIQLQEEYVVPPDYVRRLGVGEVYLIANGYGQHGRVAPLNIPPEAMRQALEFLDTEEAKSRPQPTATTPAPEQEEEHTQPPADSL